MEQGRNSNVIRTCHWAFRRESCDYSETELKVLSLSGKLEIFSSSFLLEGITSSHQPYSIPRLVCNLNHKGHIANG